MTPEKTTGGGSGSGRRSSNIYIVGFMGTGKSSVGLCLAERLGWDFCDLDAEIEKTAGETISEIFRNRGEAHFRRLESDLLKRISAGTRTVVALGGGAFCSEESRRVTAATGTSIWLDAPLEIIMSRCAGDGSRPLFGDIGAMQALLESRRPAYELADIRVAVAELTVEAVVDCILSEIRAGGPEAVKR